MAQQIMKRASVKYPDGHEVQLILIKREAGDWRWAYTETGVEVSGIAYLSESDAVRALRVSVDHEPEFTGVDLTIIIVDPPPEERAACACIEKLLEANQDWGADEVFLSDKQKWKSILSEVIAKETNLSALTVAFSELMAYVFIHRAKFAQALFPVTPQGNPRDLALDGLLLNAMEAMQASTKQDLSALIKPLKEPVSQLVIAKGVPKGHKGHIQ